MEIVFNKVFPLYGAIDIGILPLNVTPRCRGFGDTIQYYWKHFNGYSRNRIWVTG
jgi:hypothetical protein